MSKMLRGVEHTSGKSQFCDMRAELDIFWEGCETQKTHCLSEGNLQGTDPEFPTDFLETSVAPG